MTIPERWDQFSDEFREALLEVGRGELTVDEAKERLRVSHDEDKERD